MSRKKQTQQEVLANLARENSHLNFNKFVLTGPTDLGQVSCKVCQTSWLTTLNKLLYQAGCKECNRRSKKRGAIDKTITKPRAGVLLSLLESRAISREDVLAKLFPHSEEAEEAALRSESALTLLEEFLVGLEHTWVGRTAELFDHLRKLYPNSRSPQLASPRALGWAIRDWMEAGDPRISKKRTSAGQQYTIRPIEYKSEDCRSTGMLIHTLQSSTFEANEQ